MNPINRQSKLLILAVLVLAALAGDRLILTPQLKAWDERTERIAQLELDLVKGQTLLERREQLEERWEDFQSRALPIAQPSAEDLIFDSVEDWARDAGLDEVSIKPRPVKIEFEDVKSFGEEEVYPGLEFNASWTGSLDDIAYFLWLMESDPLALRVDEVEITPRDKSMSNITVNIRFDGLMIAPDEEPAEEDVS